MDSLILVEVEELIQILKSGKKKKLGGGEIDKYLIRFKFFFFFKEKVVNGIGNITSPSVLNVLWALVTGKRLEKSDPKIKKLLNLMSFFILGK